MQAHAQAALLVEPVLAVVPEEVVFRQVGVRSGGHRSIPRREQHWMEGHQAGRGRAQA